MEKNLSQQQVKTILDNAPKGTDPDKLIEGLVNRGYILQGLNDQPKVEEVKPKSPSGREAFLPATGDEGIIGGTAKAVVNAPGSAIDLTKNVVEAVTHPVETTKNVAKVLVGAGEKAGRAMGLGKDTPIMEEEQMFDSLVGHFKNRYGSIDNLKKTLIEDPVGAAADLASLFTGTGEITGAAKLAKVGKAVEPIQAAKTIKNAVGNSTAGKVLSDISPTSYKAMQGQVSKALELTPGDLATIQKSTGHDVTRFIVDHNLIKQTPEEIAHALEDTRKAKMAEVRGEVANVKDVYKASDVPAYKKSLDMVRADLEGVAGLEDKLAKVTELAKKKKITLTDVQTAKEIVDDTFDIYNRSGDVKDANKAKGLDVLRKELKKKVEDGVTVNTQGKVDIANLNNEVSTTKAIQNAIENRAMRGQTRQALPVFDAILGMATYGATGNLLTAAGIVVAKKVAESPAFRLGVAKALNKLSPEQAGKITKELAAKNLSKESIAKIQAIIDTAKSNVQYLESGSNALESVNSDQGNEPPVVPK